VALLALPASGLLERLFVALPGSFRVLPRFALLEHEPVLERMFHPSFQSCGVCFGQCLEPARKIFAQAVR